MEIGFSLTFTKKKLYCIESTCKPVFFIVDVIIIVETFLHKNRWRVKQYDMATLFSANTISANGATCLFVQLTPKHPSTYVALPLQSVLLTTSISEEPF